MASKKITTADATAAMIPEELREATPTNNLVDAERYLREQILVDLSRIKELLYGEELELDLPPEPKCMANSTWNVMVLSGMAAEITGDILRRL